MFSEAATTFVNIIFGGPFSGVQAELYLLKLEKCSSCWTEIE